MTGTSGLAASAGHVPHIWMPWSCLCPSSWPVLSSHPRMPRCFFLLLLFLLVLPQNQRSSAPAHGHLCWAAGLASLFPSCPRLGHQPLSPKTLLTPKSDHGGQRCHRQPGTMSGQLSSHWLCSGSGLGIQSTNVWAHWLLCGPTSPARRPEQRHSLPPRSSPRPPAGQPRLPATRPGMAANEAAR